MPDKEDKYSLALVGAGVRIADMLACARFFKECNDWGEVRRAVIEDNLLALNKESTATRLVRELIKRLQTLSPDELDLFIESHGDDQSAFAWLMCCRSYQILREFSEQVLARRFQNMFPDISENVYDAFAEEQEYEHEEFRRTTEGTKVKIRSTVFAMLRDCHLIANGNLITPLYPSERFVTVVSNTSSDDLLIFPQVGELL